jgi:hypothetical protein
MAKKRAAQKTKSDNGQLVLPFLALPLVNSPSSPIAIQLTPLEHSAPLDGDIVAPNYAPLKNTESPKLTLGEREHELLMRYADKYEVRFYSAMKAFVYAALLDVAVNGGLPVAQAVLRRYELPLLPEVMLSAVCGLAAIIFACVMVYFYAQYRGYSMQLWFNFDTSAHITNNWAKWVAVSFGGAWIAALAALFALVIYLSAGDALSFLRGVAWHISPTKWETQTTPSIRAH